MMRAIRNILIIPGSADCNRGDQALVWTAIDLLQDVYGKDVSIGLLSDDDDPEHGLQSRQTFRRGFPFHQLILRNPNRVLREQSGMTHAGRWNYLRVMLQSLLDLGWSSMLLLVARWPRLARALLGRRARQTYDAFSRADLAVIKGGGFIYAYKAISYYYYLWFVLFHILLAQRMRVPVVILPNSFGPFETRFSRWLASRVLRRCAVVTTREKLSQEVLDRLLPGVAHQYPDMAFLLSADEQTRQWARTELQRHGVDTGGKAVGITMRPWRFPDHPSPREAYRQYVLAMADLVRHVRQQGLQPVLFSHVQGPGLHEMDRVALEDCLKEFAGPDRPILVDGPYDCRQVKAMYGQLHAMVGTRFHSCIFALSQAVPCLSIGYQGYKADGIMHDIGLDDHVIHINQVCSATIKRALQRVLDDHERIQHRCRDYVSQLESRFCSLRAQLVELRGNR